MAKINDSMRGTWHNTGLYWHCDCPDMSMILCVHSTKSNTTLLTNGMLHSPNQHYCGRCQIYRPLKKDRPKINNNEIRQLFTEVTDDDEKNDLEIFLEIFKE